MPRSSGRIIVLQFFRGLIITTKNGLKSPDSIEATRTIVKKSCTTCLQSLPASEFYSKGKRQDTVCKSCKRNKSRATYLRSKKSTNLSSLKRFIDLMMDIEIRKLSDFESDLKSFVDERS